ncbi:MAG: hypothetical protein IIA07_00685 [Proteobacteria bacterium]|nr:hypothetical protein [Pseudomonadota bacterium]
MFDKRRQAHAVFLLALPIVVAAFGLSVFSAIGLVLLTLVWRWALTVGGIAAFETAPAVVLETISLSHFVEKVRWCLDRLDIAYTEQHHAGVLGAVFRGRSVPVLRFRTGIVYSSMGNSPEILRFLYGRYSVTQGDKAAFLEPTDVRLELEERIDRYGVNLQVWVYYHILLDRELTLHAWGVDSPFVPWWQRQLLRPLFPLLTFFVRRTFSLSDEHYAKAVHHIEEMLADIDLRLADGRKFILGGNELDYVDIAFAAISGIWLQPDGYAGGRADACRIARNRAPAPMRADIERWIEDYPKASAFIAELYANERGQVTETGTAG